MGKLLRGHYLVINGRARIILIIYRRRGRRMLWRGWRSKTNHSNLFVGIATNSSVHLTHLICEIVKTTTKVNLHLLKLCHDGLEGHITSYGGRRSQGKGWNSKSYRINRLHSWPLRSKLGLTLPDWTSTDGTHNGEKKRERNRNEEVLKDLHESWRKNELITSCDIQIHI